MISGLIGNVWLELFVSFVLLFGDILGFINSFWLSLCVMRVLPGLGVGTSVSLQSNVGGYRSGRSAEASAPGSGGNVTGMRTSVRMCLLSHSMCRAMWYMLMYFGYLACLLACIDNGAEMADCISEESF